jgi:RimJ/RimL family protein N-acetyltransferase
MVEPAIRAARSGDADALWPILEPVIREGATYPIEPDAPREAILAYWFAPDKQVFVAEAAGAAVGTYYLKPNSTGPAAHVANAGYMVHPEARGQGVAAAMAHDSFARAKALGYLAMQYNLVVATNAAALHLYRRLGMAEVGRLPRAFRHRELGLVDAVVMYRLL